LYALANYLLFKIALNLCLTLSSAVVNYSALCTRVTVSFAVGWTKQKNTAQLRIQSVRIGIFCSETIMKLSQEMRDFKVENIFFRLKVIIKFYVTTEERW